MRVVFVTHNELGLACLQELVDLGADVRSIFTRPKREEIADQIPLSPFADEHDIDLHRVESVNVDDVKAEMWSAEPELLFVVGWSQLIDQEVIDVPSTAALGMHPAPLPRGRGRAPIAWTLIKGLDETQLSFFHLVQEADAGKLVGQQPIDVERTDDAASLYDKVVAAGRTLIREYYPEFEAGRVPATSQNEAEATWWPKREPHHGLVDWRQSAETVYNWIRGQTRPYPGAFSYLDDRRVTIWQANPPTGERSFAKPGEITASTGETITVGTWESTIELTELQVADNEPVSAASLLDEYLVSIGDRFETARDRLTQ